MGDHWRRRWGKAIFSALLSTIILLSSSFPVVSPFSSFLLLRCFFFSFPVLICPLHAIQGVIVVAAIVFVVFRMTQRRFSSLDSSADELRWPELAEDGLVSGNTSTLKPLDTHRTGGAGIGDDGEGSQWGGDMGTGSIYGGDGAGHGRNPSQGTLLGYGAMQHARQASYEQLAMADGGGAFAQQHYDPFAGQGYPSAGGYGMAYPPPPSHHNSPSMDGSGEGPFGADQGRRSYPNSFTSSGDGPRGAPGAGGAYRVASPPVGARADDPFVLPGMAFGGEDEKREDEKYEGGVKEMEEKRQGPL
jgi:hypothetical protein